MRVNGPATTEFRGSWTEALASLNPHSGMEGRLRLVVHLAVVLAAAVVLLAGSGPRVEAIEPEQEVSVLVNQLIFSGRSELLEESDRKALRDVAVGARMGLDDILALADWVTIRLHEKGDLLARAYVPPQDITEGVIEIAIVEGRVEEIGFERSSGARVSETLLRQLAKGNIDSDRLTRSDLESALYRMEDLPGVGARARLEPGAAPGTSRIVVRVDQDPRLKMRFSSTNHGSTATGSMQHSVAMTLTDLTGLGDETQIQGVFSQGTRLVQVRRESPMDTRADVFGRVHFAHLNLDFSA